jgi:uncharacterized protein
MIVDFCAYIGEWPTYSLPHATVEGLLHVMDRARIDAACVSLTGGMFRFDTQNANEQLAQMVEGERDRLWPVGVLDPTLPTWRRDFQEGIEQWHFAGFRLHPNYGGYSLNDPAVIECVHALADANLPLFIASYVDEERFQHPAMRVPPVPLAEIETLIKAAPQATIVLNNLRVDSAQTLLQSGVPLENLYLDINAMDVPFDGLHTLVTNYGSDRLLFGSQIPFLYPEAARMVLAYANLPDATVQAILADNWQGSPVLAQPGQTQVGHTRGIKGASLP